MHLKQSSLVDIEYFESLGRNNFLYEYHNLNSNSSILILGGYEGESAYNWSLKYNCQITIYEPIKEFALIAEKKLKNRLNIEIVEKAVTSDGRSVDLNIINDATHLSSLGKIESESVRTCQSLAISTILSDSSKLYDLVEVDIEGMEYEILGELLCQPDSILPSTMLIQRHKVDGYGNKSDVLTSKLEEKYVRIFEIPYVWERWELKTSIFLKNKVLNQLEKHIECAASATKLSNFELDAISLTFAIVATDIYYEYFINLVKSIELNREKANIQILVFTNRRNNYVKSDKVLIRHVFIDSLPWPDITLFRFHILKRYWNWILGKIVIWIDADMRILRPMSVDMFTSKRTVLLSRHPGFSNNILKILQRLSKFNFSDVFERIFIVKSHRRSLQGWETDKRSAAYVPIEERKIYVQGGFWVGEIDKVREMIDKITHQIEDDLKIGYIPEYHDETYLNWFFSQGNAELLPRDFVVEGTYWWQNQLRGSVLCLDKSKTVFISTERDS